MCQFATLRPRFRTPVTLPFCRWICTLARNAYALDTIP